MKYYALWLVLACIGVFILQLVFLPFTEIFLLKADVAAFQPWRFVTSIFLHGSFIHLLLNVFALAFFGLILEKTIGSKPFIILFFISGVLASITAGFFYQKSLGASGAIFGIIGMLAVLRPMMTVWAFSLPMPLFVASILWAIADVLGVFFPSGTANMAHLSGLIVGVGAGLWFRTKQTYGENRYTTKIAVPEHVLRKWEALYLER
ncbi:MAG: rhomboid family intramembrane serine protease [Nanoarchaeota archaeon]